MIPFDNAAFRGVPCPKCWSGDRPAVRYAASRPGLIRNGQRWEDDEPERLVVSCPVCGYVRAHMEPADARAEVTA